MPADRLAAGTVIHTMGYPLRQDEFGGGFIYVMPGGQLSVGFVVGLDYKDPLFDPHMAFNRFKQHPYLRSLLEGGQMVRYGAKAIPEGGWNTIPQPYMDGGLIAGDAGGFLNSLRFKGIHLAMRTGMLAAESAFDAIRAGDTSAAALKRYQDKIDASPVRAELYPVRNVHQAFEYGLLAGMAVSGLTLATRGRIARPSRPSRSRTDEDPGLVLRPAGRAHGAEQCDADRSQADVRQGHQRPLLGDRTRRGSAAAPARAHRRLQHDLRPGIRASVHAVLSGERVRGHSRPAGHATACRSTPRTAFTARRATSWILYQVITWVPPEGGGGPQYNGM